MFSECCVGADVFFKSILLEVRTASKIVALTAYNDCLQVSYIEQIRAKTVKACVMNGTMRILCWHKSPVIEVLNLKVIKEHTHLTSVIFPPN